MGIPATGSRSRGVDFLDLGATYTEEERMIRDSVRAFVNDKVLPIIGDAYQEDRFPMELVPQMAEMGLFGSYLEGYGCAGASRTAYGLICQELERGDSGVRSFVSVQTSLVMFPIHAYGSEEQKQKWLPRLASGEAIGCFGLTEPDYGSDPGRMITRAERTGSGWRLNGAKMWITNGSIADVAVVWARTEDGIRGFLVEKDTPGYETRKQTGKASLRASVTSELYFDNCELGEDALLPGSGGLKSPLSCLSSARFGIAWGTVGLAAACYEEALAYAGERLVFGKPIAAHQLQQAKFADMLAEITKCQALNLRVSRLLEEGKADFAHVSLAKREGCRLARRAARVAREIYGANGIMHEYPIARHMANVESVYTYEGTDDIHTLILGQRITGHSAFE
ncbi:MAG: acyl-CoA dehydrogenase family protein [Acidobacteriota bacterium]|nr:acyl-CoA dehydrogenase family protein [Acidobacteriota bacterium]